MLWLYACVCTYITQLVSIVFELGSCNFNWGHLLVCSRNAFFIIFPLFSLIFVQILTIKLSISLEPNAYFMCNKNFADTVMMSYNVIYSVQKKKLAVSEGGSLTGVGLSGFYWIWALYLERVGKAFLGFEINVLFKIGLLFVVLFWIM